MRTIPAAITTALAAGGAQPSLSVLLQDTRTVFSVFADTGLAADTDDRPAGFITAAGTILVGSVDQSVATNAALKVRRITSPTTAAQWTAAGATIGSIAQASAGCAFAQTGSTIRLFYQRSSDLLPVYRDSTNDGVTWGAETILGDGTLPLAVGNIISAIAPRHGGGDDIHTVYVLVAAFTDPKNGASGFAYTSFTAGVWSAWSFPLPGSGPPTDNFGQVRGAQIQTVVGTDNWTAGIMRKNQRTGFGTAFWPGFGSGPQPLSYIVPMDTPTTGISFKYPTSYYDAAGVLYYVFIPLLDDGTVSGVPKVRGTLYRYNFNGPDQGWYTMATIGPTCNPQGLAIAQVAGVIYLFDRRYCYTAPAPPAALDLTPEVLSLQIHERTSEPTEATLTLSNKDGQFNGNAQIIPESRMTIATGYNGTTVATHTLYVTALRYIKRGPELTLVLTLQDAARRLNTVSQRFIAIKSKTLTQLYTYLAGAAGLAVDDSNVDGSATQTLPCFTITPGETWLAALKRLLATYAVQFQFNAAETLVLQSYFNSYSSTWSYGQELLALSWGPAAEWATFIRVVGKGSAATVFADKVDANALAAQGKEVYRHIVDRLLDTNGKAQGRALSAQLEERRNHYQGHATVALNPQLELLDCIDLTEPDLGLAAQKALIERILTDINWQDGTWLQHLTLTGT